mmetsp:Transcript_15424/g.45484  ORF Transcript_15424/g.45484 Transcript_15424/m.45484 type:complete len:410 (+) Transcript_15424:595-1824(+)
MTARHGGSQIVLEVELPAGTAEHDLNEFGDSDQLWRRAVASATKQQKQTQTHQHQQASNAPCLQSLLERMSQAALLPLLCGNGGASGGAAREASHPLGVRLPPLQVSLVGADAARTALPAGVQLCGAPTAVLAVAPAVLPLVGGGGGGLCAMSVTLSLSRPMADGASVHVWHCVAGYLRVHSAAHEPSARAAVVTFSPPPWPGRVLFEVAGPGAGAGGVGAVGDAAQLLLVPSAAAALELEAMQASTDGVRGTQHGAACHPVLVDLGFWLDDMVRLRLPASARIAAPAGAATARTADAVAEQLSRFFHLVGMPGCCDMLADARCGGPLPWPAANAGAVTTTKAGCRVDRPDGTAAKARPQADVSLVRSANGLLTTHPLNTCMLLLLALFTLWAAVAQNTAWLEPLLLLF